MASSLESVKSSGAEKKPSRGDLSTQARQLFLRLRTNERQHLVEAAPVAQSHQNEDAGTHDEVWAEQKETNLSEVWRERETDPAERLAHWNEKENDANSPLMGNGRAHVRYGAAEKLRNRKNNESRKKDKWSSAIKQIQKHKKIAGRNRAKKIDQTSRWIFPLSFVIFNLTYWIYYLYWKE
uniref:Neurotransmitter-gated ion-channel transmembrane domain-containing protein n=1 Tax=Caenorhabditis japonica TaxID=281687 RepID=A0A8R1DJ12_CAEJA